jgi:hypothetical protein
MQDYYGYGGFDDYYGYGGFYDVSTGRNKHSVYPGRHLQRFATLNAQTHAPSTSF